MLIIATYGKYMGHTKSVAWSVHKCTRYTIIISFQLNLRIQKKKKHSLLFTFLPWRVYDTKPAHEYPITTSHYAAGIWITIQYHGHAVKVVIFNFQVDFEKPVNAENGKLKKKNSYTGKCFDIFH